MRLTVLGCSGTHVGADRMCSSYLVEAGDYRFVLDMGNGSLSNLQRLHDVSAVDAVLVSHLHPDHFVDLYSFYYALRFHPDGPLSVPVFGPAAASEVVSRLIRDDDQFGQTLRFQVARAGDVLEIGPLRVTLYAAEHPVETLACRVEHDGKVIAYSADSAFSPALTECARGADLFVCDCSWLERQRPLPEGVHMTGLEAGRQATEAGAARVMVTHVFPRNDADEMADEVRRSYAGEVLVAEDLMVVEL